MRANGVWREQWRFCDRCGFLHPLSLLTKQKGLIICTCHGCRDNMEVERREYLIGRILAGSSEFENEEIKLTQDVGEHPIF